MSKGTNKSITKVQNIGIPSRAERVGHSQKNIAYKAYVIQRNIYFGTQQQGSGTFKKTRLYI